MPNRKQPLSGFVKTSSFTVVSTHFHFDPLLWNWKTSIILLVHKRVLTIFAHKKETVSPCRRSQSKSAFGHFQHRDCSKKMRLGFLNIVKILLLIMLISIHATMRGKQRKIERVQFPLSFQNYHRGAPFQNTNQKKLVPKTTYVSFQTTLKIGLLLSKSNL